MEVLLDKIKRGDIYECRMEMEDGMHFDVKIFPVLAKRNGGTTLNLGSTPVIFSDGTLYKIWVFIGSPVYKGKQFVVDVKTLENLWWDNESDSMFAAMCVSMAKAQFPVWGKNIGKYGREILSNAMNDKYEWNLA